jgi:GNAT superfamily N-acetyltransferase
MQLVPLENKHIEDAAHVVGARYARLRRDVPLLPERYASPDVWLERLQEISLGRPGMVALEGKTLVGFLVSWLVPEWRGQRMTYCPEWANGTDSRWDQQGSLYQRLYTALAPAWVAEGYCDHYISLFAHDHPGLYGWQWTGFAYYALDLVRDLRPVAGAAEDIRVRRAGVGDAENVQRLEGALHAELASAPTFLVPGGEHGQETMRAWLSEPANALWLAEDKSEPIAYLRLEPASQDVCTIIRDPGTTSITGAFTLAKARGRGVAAALLNRALSWAAEEGYVRCAVDCEAANILGARFWMHHFQPVVRSLYRHVNPAIIDTM